MMNLNSRNSEPLLPDLTIKGLPGMVRRIPPDSQLVVAPVIDRQGKSRLWVARLDRRSPPRQILIEYPQLVKRSRRCGIWY